MLNAVGIDVSKGRSTVAVLQSGGVVVRKPFDVYHNQNEMNDLVIFIKSLDGDTKAVLECTGRYHRPIVEALHRAEIFVSAVNLANTKVLAKWEKTSKFHRFSKKC